jgi:divalent metal cation (Fe/Co/Zn/Cd) transporter
VRWPAALYGADGLEVRFGLRRLTKACNYECKQMPEFIQVGVQPSQSALPRLARPPAAVFWLQGVTLGWMLVELGVSVYAAVTAHSPAMLAFGSDSLVELLSAGVVLLQWTPGVAISARRTSQTAAVLLFVLAFVVAAIAVASLTLGLRPEASFAGIGIAGAALIAMPVLAVLKRQEARRSRNVALAADAAQSAACAYLALITLSGLAVNAIFHVAWIDSVAALVAVPIVAKEGRAAWEGHACGCC